MNYQAFISYRRETGKELARLVYTELNKVRGIKTFLDIEDLGASKFDNQLRQKIQEIPNFILLLTSGTLDRCKEENDWVRQEIALAIKTEKNIVPVMVEGFNFPLEADLPEDIRDIVNYNAVPYSTHYYSASIEKLLQYLINTTCIDNDALLPKAAKEIQEQKDQETKENSYLDILTTVYLDGILSSQEKDFLVKKANEFGITPDRAKELEEQIKKESGASANATTGNIVQSETAVDGDVDWPTAGHKFIKAVKMSLDISLLPFRPTYVSDDEELEDEKSKPEIDWDISDKHYFAVWLTGKRKDKVDVHWGLYSSNEKRDPLIRKTCDDLSKVPELLDQDDDVSIDGVKYLWNDEGLLGQEANERKLISEINNPDFIKHVVDNLVAFANKAWPVIQKNLVNG